MIAGASPLPDRPMHIAVDAMGGDHGPQEVVRGVVLAARQSRAHFYVVGDKSLAGSELASARPAPPNVELVHASEVIEMGEQPTVAFRKKPDASVVVAVRMVKERRADAVVTIGNTGAAMAVSLLTLGRIKGIDRPAIATPLPSLTGTFVLLDAGATVDCDPNNLYEFALMGSIYAEHVLGIAAPRVGLLSNGEEAAKGNDLVKRTHALFGQVASTDTAFRFIGNIEGRDVFRGGADVVACDGFIGNVVLKTGEGVAELVVRLVREELTRHAWMKPFLIPLRPALKRLRTRVDYSEWGGAPMLGVNGLVIIGHGRSNSMAIANACRAAERAIAHDIIAVIRDRICTSPSPPPL